MRKKVETLALLPALVFLCESWKRRPRKIGLGTNKDLICKSSTCSNIDQIYSLVPPNQIRIKVLDPCNIRAQKDGSDNCSLIWSADAYKYI